MTPPPTTGRDGPDRLTQVLRAVSAAGLLTIAAIAAIVSYTHIHDVVLAHGETPTAAALIPLSVDGLILVASTTTLADRRAGRPRSHLATAALTLGAGASLAANIAHAQPTLTGRAVAAWCYATLKMRTMTSFGVSMKTVDISGVGCGVRGHAVGEAHVVAVMLTMSRMDSSRCRALRSVGAESCSRCRRSLGMAVGRRTLVDQLPGGCGE
jgi:Protein of unknown function (DUF2637)